MTDTEASGKVLEKELREIIRERDEMCWDEFDHAVRSSKVLEFKDIKDTNQILASISINAAAEFGVEAKELALALKKRQKAQSTEMFPGVAVTDALLPGEGRLELVLVRFAPPVSLSSNQSPTKALFIILFTQDRRDAYLRSLAAIAQAAGNETFFRKWDQPKNPERLREILLTAPRQRTCTI
jgi:mannitol/fructose-specific phosphotransferase system IIA component (Ntr-type)